MNKNQDVSNKQNLPSSASSAGVKQSFSSNEHSSSALQNKPSQAQSMSELMSRFSSKVKPIQKGDMVEGRVKKLTPKEITLDIGAKSDALVLEFDKRNLHNLLLLLKVGDKVSASVLSAESEEGFPVVSLRRTLENLIFDNLEQIYKSGQTFEVVVVEGTRGGFFAETEQGVRGFLPNSQILQEYNLVGKSVSVKIIEFDREKKRVIFSEKATVYLMDPSQIQKLIKIGDVMETTIQYVSTHGLYTTFSPKAEVTIEGFIHISEVSYQRVTDLTTLFKKGDTAKAQVIGIDTEARRVNLSIKRLEKDTFIEAKDKYKKDQKIKVKIKTVETRGILLEIDTGIDGFIQEAKIPSDSSYKVGQEIEVTVEQIDEKRRMIVVAPVLKAKPIGYR